MPQRVGVAAEQPVTQLAPPSAAWHRGARSVQRWPQAPQVEGVVRSASQPFAEAPSQSAKPAWQT